MLIPLALVQEVQGHQKQTTTWNDPKHNPIIVAFRCAWLRFGALRCVGQCCFARFDCFLTRFGVIMNSAPSLHRLLILRNYKQLRVLLINVLVAQNKIKKPFWETKQLVYVVFSQQLTQVLVGTGTYPHQSWQTRGMRQLQSWGTLPLPTKLINRDNKFVIPLPYHTMFQSIPLESYCARGVGGDSLPLQLNHRSNKCRFVGYSSHLLWVIVRDPSISLMQVKEVVMLEVEWEEVRVGHNNWKQFMMQDQEMPKSESKNL